MCVREKERETEKNRERKRERNTERKRERERLTDGERERQRGLTLLDKLWGDPDGEE